MMHLIQITHAYTFLEPLPGIGGGGTEGIGLTGYLSWLFKFALAVAAFLAVAQIVVGGIAMIAGGASETARSDAKKRIQDALWGLGLALASWLILYTINPDLAQMKLTIPEIEIKTLTDGGGGGVDPKLLTCTDCFPMTEIDKVKPELYQKLSAIIKSGACTGECQFNNQMLARLDLLMKNDDIRIIPEKNSFRLTEGYPPTVNHMDVCHYNGTCVDIALNTDKLSQDNVNKLIEAAKKSGFQVLNEYPQFGGKTTEKTTGGHLHIKF